MAVLDVRPEVVDVFGYGGDTLTLEVEAADALVSGKTWSAQVRTATDATMIMASFDVTPPSEPDGPAFLELDSETTRALANAGKVVTEKGRKVKRWSGVWDVQVSLNGDDPVRTLARGALNVDLDVTRLEP